MSEPEQLDVPEEVRGAPDSTEILRAWVSGGGLVCNLRPTVWKDASAWGIVLADVARHVANALHDARGEEQFPTLQQIRELFNRELDAPTDEPTGRLVS